MIAHAHHCYEESHGQNIDDCSLVIHTYIYVSLRLGNTRERVFGDLVGKGHSPRRPIDTDNSAVNCLLQREEEYLDIVGSLSDIDSRAKRPVSPGKQLG